MEAKRGLIAIMFFGIFLISLSYVSASRLPTPGGDNETWGTVLNEYLVSLAGLNATILNQTMVNGTNIYSSSINTTHIIDKTITDEDISSITNLTLGEKITFTLGGIIDNIVDGLITITGGLNVMGNIGATGIITGSNLNGTNTGDQDLTGYYLLTNPYGFYNPTNYPTKTDLVVVKRKNGTAIKYSQIDDTDISRGEVLMGAINLMEERDTFYLAGNTFDIGINAIDLSLGKVSIIGSGKYSTVIKSNVTMTPYVSGGAIITAGNNSLVSDLSIIGTANDISFQATYGKITGTPFRNATIMNVYMFAKTDGIFVYTTGASTLEVRGITGANNYDSLVWRDFGTLRIYDSVFNSVADPNVNSGNVARGHQFVQGTIYYYDGSITATGGSLQSTGIYNYNATAYIFDGTITTVSGGTVGQGIIGRYGNTYVSGTIMNNTDYDLYNDGTGTIYVTANTIYNVSKINGIIEYSDANTISKSLMSINNSLCYSNGTNCQSGITKNITINATCTEVFTNGLLTSAVGC